MSDRGSVRHTGASQRDMRQLKHPICGEYSEGKGKDTRVVLSLIHISEPTRLRRISYAVFCLKKKTILTQKQKLFVLDDL